MVKGGCVNIFKIYCMNFPKNWGLLMFFSDINDPQVSKGTFIRKREYAKQYFRTQRYIAMAVFLPVMGIELRIYNGR